MHTGKLEVYWPLSWFYNLVKKITDKGIYFTHECFKEMHIMLRELGVSKEIVADNTPWWNERIVLF